MNLTAPQSMMLDAHGAASLEVAVQVLESDAAGAALRFVVVDDRGRVIFEGDQRRVARGQQLELAASIRQL